MPIQQFALYYEAEDIPLTRIDGVPVAYTTAAVWVAYNSPGDWSIEDVHFGSLRLSNSHPLWQVIADAVSTERRDDIIDAIRTDICEAA